MDQKNLDLKSHRFLVYTNYIHILSPDEKGYYHFYLVFFHLGIDQMGKIDTLTLKVQLHQTHLCNKIKHNNKPCCIKKGFIGLPDVIANFVKICRSVVPFAWG